MKILLFSHSLFGIIENRNCKCVFSNSLSVRYFKTKDKMEFKMKIKIVDCAFDLFSCKS